MKALSDVGGKGRKVIEVDHQFVIGASPHRVWAVLADGFTEIGSWATSVRTSSVTPGVPLDGAPAAGRRCVVAVPGGRVVEEVISTFDPNRWLIIYRVERGMPTFVANATTSWTLASVAGDRTEVGIKLRVDPVGLTGRLLARPLLWTTKRTFRGLGTELAHIVETGRPTDKKLNKLRTA